MMLTASWHMLTLTKTHTKTYRKTFPRRQGSCIRHKWDHLCKDKDKVGSIRVLHCLLCLVRLCCEMWEVLRNPKRFQGHAKSEDINHWLISRTEGGLPWCSSICPYVSRVIRLMCNIRPVLCPNELMVQLIKAILCNFLHFFPHIHFSLIHPPPHKPPP